jgi:hypothetical protein
MTKSGGAHASAPKILKTFPPFLAPPTSIPREKFPPQ